MQPLRLPRLIERSLNLAVLGNQEPRWHLPLRSIRTAEVLYGATESGNGPLTRLAWASTRSETSAGPSPHSRPSVSPPHVTTPATCSCPSRVTITGPPLSPGQAWALVAVGSCVQRWRLGCSSFL